MSGATVASISEFRMAVMAVLFLIKKREMTNVEFLYSFTGAKIYEYESILTTFRYSACNAVEVNIKIALN